MKKAPYSLGILLSLCLCATGRPGPGEEEEEPITCKTSGIVLEGTTAEVTCDFHNDLNKTKGNFYIYRKTSDEAVILAVCKWRDGDPDCRFVDNCALKTASADGKVTFVIPSAQKRHSGDYTCKTLPANEAKANHCRLTVEKTEILGDHPVSCLTNSPANLGDDASLFCMYPKTIGITGVTLERYDSENGEKEEVLRCERGTGCNIVKDGYWVDDITDTYVRVGVPIITEDKAGHYICRSTYIEGEKGVCTLELQKQDEHDRSTKSSVLKQITLPLYAILGCIVLLILLGVVALLQSSCFLSRCFSTQTQGESQESLMRGEKVVQAVINSS